MKARIHHTDRLAGTLTPPSSKNYTTRYLLAAALADGASAVRHPARSADADALVRCLRGLGADIREAHDEAGGRLLRVEGFGRTPRATGVLDVGNAGAVSRMLMGIAALAPEARFETTFSDSLGQRPHDELFSGLEQLGAVVESRDGCLPATIRGGGLHGGTVRISGARSSQFLSALLFLAPHVGEDVDIEIVDELVSQPLVHTTLEVLAQAGIEVRPRADLRRFHIAAGQVYRPGLFDVNGDYPSAAAILAAGVLTNSSIVVERLFEDRQGERAVVNLLRQMGADIGHDGRRVELRGHDGLRGVDFDGDTATDAVLAMLPVAAHAQGTSRFHGIGNLRLKECDRIAVPVAELRRFGVDCEEEPAAIVVHGRPDGYDGGHEADTYHDHRVAQMLTLMGLRSRRGVVLRDAETVGKSYPDFYRDLIALGARIDLDTVAEGEK